jgi:hypothetical protein
MMIEEIKGIEGRLINPLNEKTGRALTVGNEALLKVWIRYLWLTVLVMLHLKVIEVEEASL